jgi:hypothetical protein
MSCDNYLVAPRPANHSAGGAADAWRFWLFFFLLFFLLQLTIAHNTKRADPATVSRAQRERLCWCSRLAETSLVVPTVEDRAAAALAEARHLGIAAEQESRLRPAQLSRMPGPVRSLSLSLCRGGWCNWHIENLISKATAHKIKF